MTGVPGCARRARRPAAQILAAAAPGATAGALKETLGAEPGGIDRGRLRAHGASRDVESSGPPQATGVRRPRACAGHDPRLPLPLPRAEAGPGPHANVPRHGTPGSDLAPKLRAHLESLVPDYMVPVAFVVLAALPRTPNGKLDRRALPAPDLDAAARGRFVPPRDEAERTLAGIFGNVLRLEKVSVEDSVFELGADSLLVFQITTRAQQAGLSISPRDVFQLRTVAALAKTARTAARPALPGPALKAIPRQATRRPGDGGRPLA